MIVGARAVLIERQNQSNRDMMEAIRADRLLSETLGLLVDVETAQRGYMLTDEVVYLDPYEAALARLPALKGDVERSIASDRTRVPLAAEFGRLVNEKLAEIEEVLSDWNAGRREDALALMRSDRGKTAMDALRALTASLRAEQTVALEREATSIANAGRLLNLGSLLALAVVILLAGVSVVGARRRYLELAAARDSLANSNEVLRREIAQREAAEAQLQQAQKMEAVGQLAGGIAHDFNNMLAVIISALNLLQRKVERGETDFAKFVDAAIDAARRAAELTARLLAFSRQQPLAPDTLDANRMVAGLSELLRRSIGEAVELETVLAGGLWRTRADPSQLENSILNLAVNARDAMPEGGKLTIETANCHLDERYSSAHPDVPAGQYVLIAVTDTGQGMPADVIARAFDPFFTTKPVGKGTGLGLSQVFGFVKQSGGHVKIYSEPGQGTTVKIYLPRDLGEATEQSQKAPVVPAGKPTETILVVEDDPRVRMLAVEALRELGYTVIHASGGKEALKRLEQHPVIDLLFTDVVMPEMNGRQLAGEFQRARPGIRVLFTTGFTKNAVVHNGVLDRGVDLIVKPYTIDMLATKVRELLDR